MRLSIQMQIILIAMLPVLLIDIFFTFVHINSSIKQAENLLQSKGAIVVKHISDASQFYLFSGNHDQIKHLLDESIDQDDVIYAAVYDSDNKIVAHASTSNFDLSNTEEYFYYHDSIYTQNISEEDIFDPYIEDHQGQSLGWVHLYLSKVSLRENQKNIFIEGIFFFLVLLLISIVLTSLISRRITKPIKRLISHLNDVEKGKLGAFVTHIESNEIGDLQRGFNSMTQSLLTHRQHLDDKIEHATKRLTAAVSSLKQKNSELAIAKDVAQKADRVKSQFLANMSHELRTPINGIKGFANLILKTGLTDDQSRYARIISQSTIDLNNIINEVLDYSKLESGKLEITESPFNLYDLVESTRDSLFAVNLNNPDVDLNLIIYSDTPKLVVGDANHLRQILINLIGNAIKFTSQGFIAITVFIEDEQDDHFIISFRIEDSGIGISNEDQKLLFQAFAQIDSDSNRKYTGTGLGLVISKNLSKLMGGDITLASQAGKGSTFIATLPFKRFEPAQTSLQDAHDNEKTIMLYAHNQRCLNELNSLYNRVGYNTESILISSTEVIEIEAYQTQLNQSFEYIDLIVFDLRHLGVHPAQIISSKIIKSKPCIIMHYDQSLVDLKLYPGFRFISVINTSERLKEIIESSEKPINLHQKTLNTDKHFSAQKILIVDDNPINLTLASELTKMWGHEPFIAKNSVEAMKIFKDHEFDLILLDIQMPKVDGVEIMQMMREYKPDLKTPIVALSAANLDTEKDKLIIYGFDAFLSKPLEEDKLKIILDHEAVLAMGERLADKDSNANTTLDYALTLQHSASNEALVLDIFHLLKKEIPTYQQDLNDAISGKVLDDIAAIMHKLHGITCYTELPKLKLLVNEYQSIKYSDPEKIFELSNRVIIELASIDNSVDFYLEQATA